jgi:hydroxyethylthiazole kinase-like uncharacterized protein yjeF
MQNMMKILSSAQIKEWDLYTIKNEPISSTELMERACAKCVDWMTSPQIRLGLERGAVVLCGKGNNGGDGFAISRMLLERGIKVTTYIIDHATSQSQDFTINWGKLKRAKNNVIKEIEKISELVIPQNVIIVDAILGSGLNKPIEGLLAEVINEVNSLKNLVVSIDIPSGMFASKAERTELAIHAAYTLTFQVPKESMLFGDNYRFTGEVEVLDIGLKPEFNLSVESNNYYLTAAYVKNIVKIRRKFDHKGIYGHALLLAGSYGKMGAAVLSAQACLRSGVGLLTIACPKAGYEILQSTVPEAMVYTIEEHEKYVSFFPKISAFKSIGIGPGIERRPVTRLMLRNLLNQTALAPLVIDADGLNLLGEIMQESPDFKIPENTIMTPHVKEFERLAGVSVNAIERNSKQIEFSKKYKVYVVLKGAYTCITTPEGTCYFNSTGNPGMATGGSGDVLTGLLTGLRAQGYSELETCILGVYIHGLAGDLAAEKLGENSLLARDIIEEIGPAFLKIKQET